MRLHGSRVGSRYDLAFQHQLARYLPMSRLILGTPATELRRHSAGASQTHVVTGSAVAGVRPLLLDETQPGAHDYRLISPNVEVGRELFLTEDLTAGLLVSKNWYMMPC